MAVRCWPLNNLVTFILPGGALEVVGRTTTRVVDIVVVDAVVGVVLG